MTLSSPSERSSFLWPLLLFLAALGFGLSAQLTYLHLQVHTNPSYRSFCAVSEKLNCETVAQSPFSVLAGLPLSVWGLLGYLLILLVGFLGWKAPLPRRPLALGCLLLLSSISLLMSLLFASISFLYIDSLCLLCLATYILNPLLLFLAFRLAHASDLSASQAFALYARWQTQNLQIAFLPAFLITALWFGYPRYWQPIRPAQADQRLSKGIDNHGHPWIGSPRPSLTIRVFSDYQCPYCRRANQLLRDKLRAFPNDLRLIHQHYPLDHHCNPTIRRPFHTNACFLAKAALCASLQGSFWHVNDFLYDQARTIDPHTLPSFAKRLGLHPTAFLSCLQNPKTQDLLRQEISSALSKRVQGTPFFFLETPLSTPGFWSHDRGLFGLPRSPLLLQAFVDYADKDSTKALHDALTLLQPHQDRLRVLLRTFPQEPSCNPSISSPKARSSCFFAKAYHCAGRQNAFPSIHHLLLHTGKLFDEASFSDWTFFLNLSHSRLSSCIQDPKTTQAIQDDLQEALASGLKTPGFVFQGRAFPGRLPPSFPSTFLSPTPPPPSRLPSPATPALPPSRLPSPAAPALPPSRLPSPASAPPSFQTPTSPASAPPPSRLPSPATPALPPSRLPSPATPALPPSRLPSPATPALPPSRPPSPATSAPPPSRPPSPATSAPPPSRLPSPATPAPLPSRLPSPASALPPSRLPSPASAPPSFQTPASLPSSAPLR